jgi:outer membrane protein TolC
MNNVMNRSLKNSITLLIIVIFGCKETFAQQTKDSLSLNNVVKEIVQNYPAIKEAEEAVNMADTKIGLAKSGYLPNADLAATYTRIWPVISLEFPMNGELRKFQLYPENSFNSAISVNEKLLDFGRTKSKVNIEKGNKDIAQQSLEEAKQNLAITAISIYYSLLYLQEAITIKNKELDNFKNHLKFVQKKQETGSATQYEVLTTQVRISGIESEKLDLETAFKTRISNLNSFLSFPADTNYLIKKELITQYLTLNEDSAVTKAMKDRDEIKSSLLKENLAELNYNMQKTTNRPSLSVFGSYGLKNGFASAVNELKWNYAAGATLAVPIFDAFRNQKSLKIGKSAIQNSKWETEIVKRKINDEVIEDYANLESSSKKIEQFRLQLQQANKALSLAQISYKAGVITNLDLLDATTRVSESELLFLKAQIDYTLNVYRLRQSIGERLY